MIGIRRCSMCETDEGNAHPVTGRPIERLIVNNQCTSYICFDCVSRCVEILAADEEPHAAIANREQALVESKTKETEAASSASDATTDDLTIRELHEPVFYAEEGIIR